MLLHSLMTCSVSFGQNESLSVLFVCSLFCLSVLSVCLSACLFCLFCLFCLLYLYVCPFVCLSASSSLVCLSSSSSLVCLAVHLSVFLCAACAPACLPACFMNAQWIQALMYRSGPVLTSSRGPWRVIYSDDGWLFALAETGSGSAHASVEACSRHTLPVRVRSKERKQQYLTSTHVVHHTV